jgi:aminoglycoside phosphotransferase (APT) family kinase protein
MKQPGPLLAAGRDADIFEYGAHSVLRRSRAGRSMALEAKTMDYLAAHGYPVPTVEELSDDGRDLVMQRIDGRSMVEQLSLAPWTVRRQADTLARLHLRLHEIPRPDFLPPAPFSEGSSILHLDLHPLNVLISDSGPVVIDWTSACVGSPYADVALAWLLMSAGDIPGGRLRARLMGLGRDLLTNRFFAHFDPNALLPQLHAVAAWKAADANMTQEEVASLWRAVHRGEAETTRHQ